MVLARIRASFKLGPRITTRYLKNRRIQIYIKQQGMVGTEPTASYLFQGFPNSRSITDRKMDTIHDLALTNLVATVKENLCDQHSWTQVQYHTHTTRRDAPSALENGMSSGQLAIGLLPRPIVSGLPPRRLYLHPDDQIELLRTHTASEIETQRQYEWVLPMHLSEKLTLESFAAVFDAMYRPPDLKPGRAKRLLLAIVHNDSTIVYYFVHDGIVKPRPN